MLYFNFKNYEEFKELFGVRECGNGQKSRRNKILLAFFKDRNFVKQFLAKDWHQLNNKKKEHYIKKLRSIESMADLRTNLLALMRYEKFPDAAYGTNQCYWCIDIMYDNNTDTPYRFASTKYELDGRGICYDGDVKSIRYRNVEADHIYKMKAGKFLRHLIEENPFGQILPEQAKVWLCEDFAERWTAWAMSKCPDTTLHVGDALSDFEAIYDGSRYDGNFGSCMSGEDQYYFYHYAVDAKAAWIENKTGKMLARCVIFTQVRDEDGNKWRLAERQYSSQGDNSLKRILVDKLIEAGEIDGYKQVGVDCHSGTSFVANDGTSLEDKSFRIECHLERGDTLSYQDSFKYYNIGDQIAYNHCEDAGDYTDLATTDSTFEGGGVWSDYNQEYIPEDNAYYDDERADYYYEHQVRYCENTKDYRFEDDCVPLGSGGYAYLGYRCEGRDDVMYCDECGEYYLSDDACYSELTEEHYCCDNCRECAEQSYMKRHKDSGEFAFDEINDEWFKVEDYPELVRVLIWDWTTNKRKNALTRMFNKRFGRIFKYGTNWYHGNVEWNTELCVYEPREKVAC